MINALSALIEPPIQKTKQKPLSIELINANMDGQNQGEEVWIACDGVEGLLLFCSSPFFTPDTEI